MAARQRAQRTEMIGDPWESAFAKPSVRSRICTRRAKFAFVRNVRNQNDLTDCERGRSSTGEDRSLPIQTTALEHPGSKGGRGLREFSGFGGLCLVTTTPLYRSKQRCLLLREESSRHPCTLPSNPLRSRNPRPNVRPGGGMQTLNSEFCIPKFCCLCRSQESAKMHGHGLERRVNLLPRRQAELISGSRRQRRDQRRVVNVNSHSRKGARRGYFEDPAAKHVSR